MNLISGEAAEDPEMFAALLKRFIRMHVTIVDEFEELLISPVILLNEIWRKGRSAGDCDDIAMLAASVLASVGAQVNFKAVFPQPDGSYAHVIIEYCFPRQGVWKDFDATIPGDPVYPPDFLIEEIVS